MKSKTSSKQILLVVVFTVLMVFMLLAFFYIPKISIQGGSALIIKNTVAFPEQEQVVFGLPVRLEIPSINVDALVEHLGLTSDGAMDVSKGPSDVAWFNLGPRPGDKGSAVIAGHYGHWITGEQGVFNDLDKLKAGDKIYIKDDGGAITAFVVRRSQSYDDNESVPDVFVSSDEKAHLNLITCQGAWDKVNKSYPERLVVYADKEFF